MIAASRRRLWLITLVVAALLISLGVRLWNVQVLNTRAYVSLAAQDELRQVVVPSVRGEILDDTGQPLVDNKASLVVSVNVAELDQRYDENAELERLAKLLHTQTGVINDKLRLCTRGVSQPCWAGSPYQPVPVAQNVSDTVALQIMENQQLYPDITAEVEPIINYPEPDGANPAQEVGYLLPADTQQLKQLHLTTTGFSGVDLVGQAGLEAQYDPELRGTPGVENVRVNADGQVTSTAGETPPKAGDDLVTSINGPLQADVQNILGDAILRAQEEGRTGAKTGAAVVLTTTGRVVAMASYPSYNPSVWTGGISEREFKHLFGTGDGEPILNRVTQGEYAPGSTWKVTTTAAAVAEGYSLNGLYNCPAAINIDGQNFYNDGNPNEGAMTLSEALIQSCDTVFFQLGYDMYLRDDPAINSIANPNAPTQPMQKMELDWGFGDDPGIDLPEQSPGSVPTRQWLYYYWKQYESYWCSHANEYGTPTQQENYGFCKDLYVWEPGQSAIAAIGQGYVNVTPLQLADAYVALANGGTLYSPRIGEALISPSGKVVERINPPVIRHLPVSGYTLAYIRHALQGVVTSGTAAGAFGGFPLGRVCVAGKTGTAQVQGQAANSVFASFAPCYHPKYVIVVIIPDTGYGADFAAPTVRKIWDAIYGLEGQKAAMPNGQVPGSLPTIGSNGEIKPPAGYGSGG
jgi:penicillin-binding protein 2